MAPTIRRIRRRQLNRECTNNRTNDQALRLMQLLLEPGNVRECERKGKRPDPTGTSGQARTSTIHLPPAKTKSPLQTRRYCPASRARIQPDEQANHHCRLGNIPVFVNFSIQRSSFKDAAKMKARMSQMYIASSRASPVIARAFQSFSLLLIYFISQSLHGILVIAPVFQHLHAQFQKYFSPAHLFDLFARRGTDVLSSFFRLRR